MQGSGCLLGQQLSVPMAPQVLSVVTQVLYINLIISGLKPQHRASSLFH